MGLRLALGLKCVLTTPLLSTALCLSPDAPVRSSIIVCQCMTGAFTSGLSMVYAWNVSNTDGHTKKSTVNVMTLSLVSFSIGNIIGTEIFQPKDAPGYIPGKTATSILVLMTVQLAICFLIRWINIRLNAKKTRR